MLKKSCVILALVASTTGISTLSHAADAKQALDSFHAALAAGDKAKALELLAPEVAIYEAGFVERSRDEYANHHLQGDMAFAKSSARKVLKQTERTDGNTAIIWAETETKGTSRGKELHVLGTETAILEKKGDSWAIVHVHWSSRKAK
jgi:hypothetical protein